MTPEVQHLHFRKYNQWWSTCAKKMKKSMRPRLRWSEEQWSTNVSHCAIFNWVVNQTKGDAGVTPEMIEAMTSSFLSGLLVIVLLVVFNYRIRFFQSRCWVFISLFANNPRDYSQDLDAILLAKPAKFTPEMTAMWQDHIGRAMLRPPGSTGGTDDSTMAVDEAEDMCCFQLCIKLNLVL